MDFDEFVTIATDGAAPYRYQRRLAESGLPDVLRVPTGAGKTLAAALPWLYRCINGMEPTRWLVLVLPQRTLVEQTDRVVRSWLANLTEAGVLADVVPVHVLMGGEDSDSRAWKIDPDRVCVFVGTQDMVLSRLLMRGFAEARTGWPMTFGLLHSGTQFVFDEVQLMGPGLLTSLQLQGLRESIGTAMPCRTMWMSATVEPGRLRTVDFQRPLRVEGLDDADRAGGLKMRLTATRRVGRMDLAGDARAYPKELAARVLAEHRPGTRTLVVLNTVDRAIDVYEQLARQAAGAGLVLLHSRFRPDDRREHTERATTGPGPAGDIVVSTQVLEAGVDMTSTTLITELAPWSSIVQRAGRCNRDGQAHDARLWWVSPPGKTGHLPYEPAELANSATVLAGLEGQALTGEALAAASADMVVANHPVLRRRDLRDLFDTAPDLDGNDIDVSPFIRDADDRTVFIAWRDWPLPEEAPMPGRAELCPAPVAAVRTLMDRAAAQVFDQQDGRWRAASRADIRPTAMLMVDATAGGYLPEIGFAPASRAPVPPVPVRSGFPDAVDTDPQSTGQTQWLSLADHSNDTEHAALELLDALAPTLSETQRTAVAVAARFHDLGKAHPTFQDSLVKANPDQPPPDSTTIWAKSPGSRPLRSQPPHFRHELVSALLLDADTDLLADVAERDLVVYLALAHHGKARLAVRAVVGEAEGVVLGVQDGSITRPAGLPDGSILPSRTLSLAPLRLGPGSFTGRALRLRDRDDLGVFRLALCEALVRCADWRASRSPTEGTTA